MKKPENRRVLNYDILLRYEQVYRKMAAVREKLGMPFDKKLEDLRNNVHSAYELDNNPKDSPQDVLKIFDGKVLQ